MKATATRREVIAGSLAAAGFAAFAGPAAAATTTTTTTASVPSETEVLALMLTLERLMVLAYRRVLASGTLEPSVQPTVTVQLDHEVQHVAAVAARLTALGQPAPTGQLDLASGQALLAHNKVSGSLTHISDQRDALRLLVNLESLAEGVHYAAIMDLSTPSLIRLSAQIMSCEAQHWTVLSGIQHPGQYVKAVPWPFVQGNHVTIPGG
jgi:hypothetical protein